MKRSLKKRTEEHTAVYEKLLEVIKKSEYDGTEDNDGKKGHTADQDVYHAAVRWRGKLYAVRIKVDVATEFERDNQAKGIQIPFDSRYVDHSVASIDTSEVQESPGINGEPYAGFVYEKRHFLPDAATRATEVTLGVIRGDVKPRVLLTSV